MKRDFTFIDDIVEGVVRVMKNLPDPNAAWSGDHRIPAPPMSATKFTTSATTSRLN
jgi:UDP-glucuronate 4-epimerase